MHFILKTEVLLAWIYRMMLGNDQVELISVIGKGEESKFSWFQKYMCIENDMY
jgi:hypothetical protein